MYVICQSALWWLFHITSFFWKVVFPFHARSFSKIRHVHITCIIIGIIFPLLPVLTSILKFSAKLHMKSENSTSQVTFLSGGLGFRSTRFPPLLCISSDPDAMFYSLVLIVDLILASGCTLLLIIFWSLHRFYKRERAQVDKYITTYISLNNIYDYYLLVFNIH